MFRAKLTHISTGNYANASVRDLHGRFEAQFTKADLAALQLNSDIVILSQQEYTSLLFQAQIPTGEEPVPAPILISPKCSVCETNDAIQNGIRCRACITAKRTTKIPIPAISKETDRFSLIELE